MTKKSNGQDKIRLLPIADYIEFESQKGMVKMTFYTSRLDKKLLPNHLLKLSEVILDSDTATQVALSLSKHAQRGNAEPEIKTTPLPEILLPKKN